MLSAAQTARHCQDFENRVLAHFDRIDHDAARIRTMMEADGLIRPKETRTRATDRTEEFAQ